MAQQGGKRPGAGRPKGAKHRADKEQKTTLGELARAHTETAIAALADIAENASSEAARVSAAIALLDRGFGKPVQMVEPGRTDSTPQKGIPSDLELARAIAFILAKGATQQSG